MKKIIYFILSSFIVICFNSCDIFRIDNYDEPDQTLWGEVIDKFTGQRMLTDQGSEGVRIRLYELSWSSTPSPLDFWCMKEGIFQNTKIFSGYYNVQIDGPFIPLIGVTPQNDTIWNNSWFGDIKGGTTKVKFEVEPFLHVEWVGEPTVTPEGRIRATFKVTRPEGEQYYRDKMSRLQGWNNNSLEVANLYLFVSHSAYVGYREGREGWRDQSMNGNEFVTSASYGFGNTITLETPGPFPVGHRIFVRCGARIRYSTQGQQRPLYTDIKYLDIPTR